MSPHTPSQSPTHAPNLELVSRMEETLQVFRIDSIQARPDVTFKRVVYVVNKHQPPFLPLLHPHHKPCGLYTVYILSWLRQAAHLRGWSRLVRRRHLLIVYSPIPIPTPSLPPSLTNLHSLVALTNDENSSFHRENIN